MARLASTQDSRSCTRITPLTTFHGCADDPNGRSKRMRLSVVTPVYNERATLRQEVARSKSLWKLIVSQAQHHSSSRARATAGVFGANRGRSIRICKRRSLWGTNQWETYHSRLSS